MSKSQEKSPNKKEKEISPKTSPKEKKLKPIYEMTPSLSRNIDSSFPKNANEYRHLIDDIKCCKSDIEFMLELRRYKALQNIDKISSSEPSFYQQDLNKYKDRIILKPEEKKFLQVNMGLYKYILDDKSKYSINVNNPTFKYEVRLRTEGPTYNSSNKIYKTIQERGVSPKINKKIENTNRPQWDSSIIPKNHSLFDTLLPPILKSSKEIYNKNEKIISRPVIIKHKDGYVNGEKIKSRIFDYNSGVAYRYPSEHYPNSRYNNDYGQQNIGAIKHLLNSDNITTNSIWCTYLRGIKKKNVSLEDIKKTEKKLKDISIKKSLIK